MTSDAGLEHPQDQQQIQSIFVTDDNIIYITPPPINPEVAGGTGKNP